MKIKELALTQEAFTTETRWLDPASIKADYAYQRGVNLRWVQHLSRDIIDKGYGTPKVSVNERPDGSFFAVDGNHKVHAHVASKTKKIQADVYHIPVADEPKLFLILNNTKRIAPNYIVSAWDGPTTSLIIFPAGRGCGVLAARINYGVDTKKPFAASHLAKGIHAALTGIPIWAKGGIPGLLRDTDLALAKKKSNVSAAKEYVDIVAREFKESRAFELPLIAMGKVFHDYGAPKAGFVGGDKKWVVVAKREGRNYENIDAYISQVKRAWGFQRSGRA